MDTKTKAIQIDFFLTKIYRTYTNFFRCFR